MAVAPGAGAPSEISGEPVHRVEEAAVRAQPVASSRRDVRTTAPAWTASPWIVVGLWALLALPLAVALGVLRSKHWVPIGDIAQTELRVRDVASRHPPLIGLAGRIGPFYRQGSHPGPLSFWAMWPIYRLLGSTPMALVASGTALQLLAVGGTLWLGFRRGGLRLVIGLAVVLALLTRGYGSVTLTEPWNPFLPVMWWSLFLVAVWSVLCDDVVALPIAVFAGSFCMETHISYVGLVGGLTLVLIAGFALALRRRRSHLHLRRQALHWGLGGLALGVVLWVPPVIEQFTTNPGNGTVIWRHFSDPPEAAIGLGKGLQLILVPLNPWWWINARQEVFGSIVPGCAVVVAWAAAALITWRLGHRVLLRLHIVVGVALALGLFSAAKIFGPIYYYLVLWDWGVGGLLFLAVGWTIGLVIDRRLEATRRDRVWLGPTAGLFAIAVLATGVFTVSASSTEFRAVRPSEILRRVVGPTAGALARGRVPGGGRRGHYLVTWTDPISIGTQGFGLVSELERRGFHVGADEVHGPGVTFHRVLRPGRFSAVIHLSVGGDINVWRAKPGVQEVAYVDLRSRRERAEYARLRLAVIAGLKAANLGDRIGAVDDQLYGAALDAKVPRATFLRMVRMLDLGLPTAVFVGPPSTAP